MTRLEPHEAKSRVGDDDPDRERATRQALAVNPVACVNQLRCFGDLVADLAAQAAAGLRKFHSDYFSCHGATDRMARASFPDGHSATWSGCRNQSDDDSYPPKG